jgi:catechol 2,3-dioxygenase-like lactoylglutathione lyase family enzyme
VRKDIVGVNHFGFPVRDLEATRKQLKKLGAEIVEDDLRGAYDFIFAKGPDGELIGFAAFKNHSEESES